MFPPPSLCEGAHAKFLCRRPRTADVEGKINVEILYLMRMCPSLHSMTVQYNGRMLQEKYQGDSPGRKPNPTQWRVGATASAQGNLAVGKMPVRAKNGSEPCVLLCPQADKRNATCAYNAAVFFGDATQHDGSGLGAGAVTPCCVDFRAYWTSHLLASSRLNDG